MRRLGDVDPDSGHPTPRDDDEHYTDERSESPFFTQHGYHPLTSTPISDRGSRSVRSFFERSERNQSAGEGNSDTTILVESVKELIQAKEKNMKLEKENRRILNDSQIWNQEKENLEKQVRDSTVWAKSLQSQLEEKDKKIEDLEARVRQLLRTLETITEHPSEEGFEASEELVIERKDAYTQCEQDLQTAEGKSEASTQCDQESWTPKEQETHERCDEDSRLPEQGTRQEGVAYTPIWMRSDICSQCEGYLRGQSEQENLVSSTPIWFRASICSDCEESLRHQGDENRSVTSYTPMWLRAVICSNCEENLRMKEEESRTVLAVTPIWCKASISTQCDEELTSSAEAGKSSTCSQCEANLRLKEEEERNVVVCTPMWSKIINASTQCEGDILLPNDEAKVSVCSQCEENIRMKEEGIDVAAYTPIWFKANVSTQCDQELQSPKDAGVSVFTQCEEDIRLQERVDRGADVCVECEENRRMKAERRTADVYVQCGGELSLQEEATQAVTCSPDLLKTAVYCQCDEEQRRWRPAWQSVCAQCEEQLHTQEDATQKASCSPDYLKQGEEQVRTHDDETQTQTCSPEFLKTAVYCQCDEELLSQQRWRTAEMCVQCEEQLQTKEDATQTLTCSPELLQTAVHCQCDEELLSQRRWRTAEVCVQCEEQLRTQEEGTQTATCSSEVLKTAVHCQYDKERLLREKWETVSGRELEAVEDATQTVTCSPEVETAIYCQCDKEFLLREKRGTPRDKVLQVREDGTQTVISSPEWLNAAVCVECEARLKNAETSRADASTQCDDELRTREGEGLSTFESTQRDEELRVQEEERRMMELLLLHDRIHLLSAENEELQNKLDNLQSLVDQTATLKREIEQYKEKCVFLESENQAIRKEEETMLKETEASAGQLVEMKEKFEHLNSKVEVLRKEKHKAMEAAARNQELEWLLSEKERTLEESATQCLDLKSSLDARKLEIEELKASNEELKRLISEKEAEADRLSQECEKLQQMSAKLTEDNVFSAMLSEELKMRLSRASTEIDELNAFLGREKQSRKAAEENAARCADLERKLRQREAEVEELRSVNDGMSQEVEFLRQVNARSTSKEEMEQCRAALNECRDNLKQAIAEKEALLQKEASYTEQIAKLESLRYELKCRDDLIAELRSAETKLQDTVTEKTAELNRMENELRRMGDECARVREEFHVFQEMAERQYCEKLEQIDALSSRLAQLESYPGQTVSIDCQSCLGDVGDRAKSPPGDTVTRALYDCILPAVRELVEKAANESRSVAEAIREMRDTAVTLTSAQSNAVVPYQQATSPPPPEKFNAKTQTSESYFLENGDSIPVNQLLTSIENYRDPNANSSLLLIQSGLRRLLTAIRIEPTTDVMNNAVRCFLEDCRRQFSDAEAQVREDLRVISEAKDALEKRLNSEKMSWIMEREQLEAQMDRYRRQSEQLASVQKERLCMMSELNAGRIQMEEYRARLRQLTEQLETVTVERDSVTQLADAFQKLDQESQEEVKKANAVIDELERQLLNVRAELERERREGIRLRDDNDASTLAIQRLRNEIGDLEQRIVELSRKCERLEKTERYNQKTIQIVCESFWEREEFVQRLRHRSYERKKLIEHFVNNVGEIISTFKGDQEPVDTMQATIKSWTVADVQDEVEHESREKALTAQVQELGSGHEMDIAQKRVLSRLKKRH